MNKTLLMLGFCLFCLTISAKRVGVYCFFSDNGTHLYEDTNIKVVIALDGDKGQLAVYNKTDNIIYVDKANSFAYTNGQPETLFKNSSHTTTKTKGKGGSLNFGGVAGALGISGVAGGVLQGTTVGGGTSVQSGTTVYEQRIIAIAPKSAEILYTYSIMENLRQDYITIGKYGDVGDMVVGYKGKFINPYNGKGEKFQKGMSRHYEENATPLDLKGVVKYSTDENFSSSELAQVSLYISDIVIDSYKGVNNPNRYLPYCQPYNGKQYYSFKTGGTNPLSMAAGYVGAVCLILGGATMIIIGLA